MTGRKTLQQIREQLATARAAAQQATDTPEGREALAALDRLVEELRSARNGFTESEPSSKEAADQTKPST